MESFKALYGQDCLSPLNFSGPTIWVEASKETIAKMDEKLQAVRKDIKAAPDHQKEFADTKRSTEFSRKGIRYFLKYGQRKVLYLLVATRNLAQNTVNPMR